MRCFQSAYDLVDCIKNRGGFDAYLLDILMPYMNGIDLGMAIREIGDQAPIIYLTSSKDYAVDSYRVSTFYYILKPATAEKINEVLDKLFEKLAANPEKPLLVRHQRRDRPGVPKQASLRPCPVPYPLLPYGWRACGGEHHHPGVI